MSDSMIPAPLLRVEELECLDDVFGWPLLPRVRDGAQSFLPGMGKHALELRRRMTLFRGVEAHPLEERPEAQCLPQRSERLFLAQVPQEAHDERGGDAELALAFTQSAGDAFEHNLHRNAARGVRLRVAEDLGVHYPVGLRAAQ